MPNTAPRAARRTDRTESLGRRVARAPAPPPSFLGGRDGPAAANRCLAACRLDLRGTFSGNNLVLMARDGWMFLRFVDYINVDSVEQSAGLVRRHQHVIKTADMLAGMKDVLASCRVRLVVASMGAEQWAGDRAGLCPERTGEPRRQDGGPSAGAAGRTRTWEIVPTIRTGQRTARWRVLMHSPRPPLMQIGALTLTQRLGRR